MHSQSIGTGRVTDGELTLRPNAAAPEDPEQFHAHINSEVRQRSNHAKVESGVVGSDARRVDQSITG